MEKLTNMNSQIDKAINEVTKLDSWDIQSILGGVNYLARQTAINTVVRMIPAPPEEGSGLEGFAKWEQEMKNPEIKKAVTGIVGIAEKMTATLRDFTDLPPSEYEDVLQFMVSRPPLRQVYQAEYDARKRAGMRPAMPMSTFVDMEYAQAMNRHAQIVAKGEAAVHLLHSVDGSDEGAPEWLYESINAKLLQKLEDRWMRAELRRTNTRIKKADRDIAEANQLMIEACIVELGGKKPDFTEEMKNSDDIDDFNEAMRKKALGNTDAPTSDTPK